MSKKFPVVSIVMPVYNAERYLELAIKSILNQTHEDYEFIIIDDGSMDDTLDIIKAYSKNDKRIRILVNQKNLGIVASLNYGLANARGKYIARMDADDYSHPLRIEKQVAYLDSHPEIGLLGTAYRSIDETGHCLVIRDIPSEDIVIRWISLFNCAFNHPSVMFRNDIYKIVGGYNPDMENAEDYDLWSRMLHYTKVANLLDPLVDYRKNELQISRLKRTEQEQKVNLISTTNINSFMNQEKFISIDEASVLRSWYYPSDKIIISLDSIKILAKLIDINNQFREKYPYTQNIEKYVVFIIINVLKRVPLPLQKKIKFFYQAVKINPIQSIKTTIGLLIRFIHKHFFHY
jgi:glycosyltransferase involved in cell wall biosynthesis